MQYERLCGVDRAHLYPSKSQATLARFFDPAAEPSASDSANHASMSSSSGSSKTGSATHGSTSSGVAGESNLPPPAGESWGDRFRTPIRVERGSHLHTGQVTIDIEVIIVFLDDLLTSHFGLFG